MKIIRILFTLCLAGFLPGCHLGREVLPKISDPEILDPSRSELLTNLDDCAANLATVKVLGRAISKKGDERAAYRLSVVLDGQGRGRIETFAPSSAFVLQALVIDGQQVSALDYSRQQAFLAQNSTRLLRKLLGFSASTDRLKALFLGCLPPDLVGERRVYRGKSVWVTSANGNEVATFSGDKSRLEQFVSASALDGLPDYKVTYEWDELGKNPRTLTLTLYRDRAETVIILSKLSTNEALPPGIFSLHVPENVSVEDF